MKKGELDFSDPPHKPARSSSESVRLAVDERDLRRFLSDGFIAAPDSYPPGRIRSLAQVGHAWTLVTPGMVIPVASDAKPCVIEVNQAVSPGEDLVHGVLPSSAITRVHFLTKKARMDFERRNSVLSGLATAHFEYAIDPDLRFHPMEAGEGGSNQTPSDPDASSMASAFDESNRSAGALTAVMAGGVLPMSVLTTIEMMSSCNRELVLKCLEGICQDEDEGLSDSLGFVLDILSHEQWSGGFDPSKMLDSLSDGLSIRWRGARRLERWAETTREIIENRSEADPDLMQDGKNTLLRGLFLILRTSPLNVHAIEHWNTAEPVPGQAVMACSLVLTGWYRGFAQQEKAKENPALYRFASKALASAIGGDPVLNPQLKLVTTVEGIGIRSHTLQESGEAIAATQIKPDPALMEALYQTKRVTDKSDDPLELDFDAEEGVIIVRGATGTVQASRQGHTTIRWSTTWTWIKKGRLRSWKIQHFKAIAQLAESVSCSVYPITFPRCGLHIDQLIGTQDDDEIFFHLKALFDTLKELDELGAIMPSDSAKKSPKSD